MMKPDLDLQQISAYIDGELEFGRQLEMESRVEQDAELRATVESLRRLREGVRSAAEYHRAPAAMRGRIPELRGVPTFAAPAALRPVLQRWLAWRPFALALALVGVLAGGWGLSYLQTGSEERLAQEAIASHVRATLGQRLVDVASSDEHTVKPWLSSKLDFSPPVYDLQMRGAVFLGGRVDYLDGRPVAALVYKQREHVIDAFVWPTHDADLPMSTISRRGFNLQHWTRAGMTFWIVSDLGREELATLARSLDRAEGSR